MYQNVIIPYLYEAQHVSGDTQPIIWSLKLHWKPLVLHSWNIVGRVVGGLFIVKILFFFYNMMHGSMNVMSILAGQLLKAVISITISLGPFLSSHHTVIS